jgi:hypothetical protein
MRQASPAAQNTDRGGLELFPIQSASRRFSLLRGISPGGRLEAVGSRGPGQETPGGYYEGDPRWAV